MVLPFHWNASRQSPGRCSPASAVVVGLYGILYFEVARAPEGGWLIAAVGLTGKVLGPAGMLWLIWSGAWPASALTLCLTNDFIWWVPFALYLRDAWPAFRAHAAF
jgi:hypothetical protein